MQYILTQNLFVLAESELNQHGNPVPGPFRGNDLMKALEESLVGSARSDVPFFCMPQRYNNGKKCTNLKKGGAPPGNCGGKIFNKQIALLYLGLSKETNCNQFV